MNNAGVGVFAPLGAVTVDDFDSTFAVNVRGPLLLIQALLPHSARGSTATDFNGGVMRDDEAMHDALSRQTALGRVRRPKEISDAIVALVSDEFRWVTGERIEISGRVLM